MPKLDPTDLFPVLASVRLGLRGKGFLVFSAAVATTIRHLLLLLVNFNKELTSSLRTAFAPAKMSHPSPLPTYLYKILDSAPPDPLPTELPLSPLDANDGFIHLSTAAQTSATASRFFADLDTLHILRIPLKVLENGRGRVKWEESMNHGVFAHLYDVGLGRDEVEEVMVMKRGDEGWEKSLNGLPA